MTRRDEDTLDHIGSELYGRAKASKEHAERMFNELPQ
jgi:hypothetical protein